MVVGLAAIGLLLAAFVLVERRARDPVCPPETWSDRRLTSSASGLVLLSFSVAVIAGSAAAPRLTSNRPYRAMGPEHRRGMSAALINSGGQVGTAVGVAVVLAVAGTDGHRYGWLLSAAIAVAGFAALRRDRT